VIRDVGADGATGAGRHLVPAGARDRYYLARLSVEEPTSFAESKGALDGRHLPIALPGGTRLVRVGARAAARAVPRTGLPVPLGPATPGLSPTECTRSAQVGGWLFRHRGLLPVPLGLLAACVPGDMTGRAWAMGLALIALGEVLRLAAVAVAGPETRRRSRAVARLVTDGPFGWVRNPLYVGNALTWLGVAVIAGIPWLLPLATMSFAIEYGLIVRYEEGVLESLFGEAYLAYKGRTARWVPRRPAPGPRRVDRRYDWRRAWRSESSTFTSLAVAMAVLVVKELLLRG
jgi:protein-S-isoprenylcysteine O-methyltransferase Ste14